MVRGYDVLSKSMEGCDVVYGSGTTRTSRKNQGSSQRRLSSLFADLMLWGGRKKWIWGGRGGRNQDNGREAESCSGLSVCREAVKARKIYGAPAAAEHRQASGRLRIY